MNEYGDTKPVVHAVRCTYPQCQATNGCVGVCSKTAPPKREWVGLTDEKEIIELSKDAWGRDKLSYGRDDHLSFYVAFARAIEAKLKEKNT